MTDSEDAADVTDVVVELAVAGGEEAVELASGELWAAGASAVGETVGGVNGPAGTAAGERMPGVVTLVASFPTPDAARVVAAELGGVAVEITDRSWQDRWKDFAEPVLVGAGLVVAPAWRDVEVDRRRVVLRIDPGACFGSGSHPSTRLILQQLAAHPPVGASVLDVGCGSGILSIAAAALGAASVEAVDIHPGAVTATEDNASANGVGHQVHATTRPLDDLGGGFDLVLVNVTAGVHAILGPSAVAAVRPGGLLLLAGLLSGQWRHVVGAYPGTEVVDRSRLDGWKGLVLRSTFREREHGNE